MHLINTETIDSLLKLWRYINLLLTYLQINTHKHKNKYAIHCVPKTGHYIFFNNFDNKCPITIIFGIVSIVSLGVIERWLYFPPHLSSSTTLPWEIAAVAL